MNIRNKLYLLIAGAFALILFSGGEAFALVCSSCGKWISDYSNFCNYCGVRVAEKTTSQPLIDKEKLNWELLRAADRGDTGKINALIEAGADIEAPGRGRAGGTILGTAAGRGDIDILRYLCEKGAAVDARDNDNWTPLMKACSAGRYDVAEYLIGRGAAIDAPALIGSAGERTPLMQAAFNGHAAIVELLLKKGANADYKNIKGDTAFSLAKSKFNMKIASMLEDFAKNPDAAAAGSAVDIERLRGIFEKDGGVYLSYTDGSSEKIGGLEVFRYPSLSADRRYACFVRTYPPVTLGMACGDVDVTDLYAADLSRSRIPFQVVEGSRYHLANIYDMNAGINSPQFSADGSKIYYMCAALLDASAVKVVDLRSKEIRFLTLGKSLRVIQDGKFRDHFISLQRKYSREKYPREVYCLFGPSGEEIREINTVAGDVEKEFFGGGR
ncbi:MAG: hypothetical protein A2008_08140 [Candidatus Wallbacteria bacterium GWC2_49_35]|uniref:Uncharacterized protein n=1 Tax=Candidatus Wallbacteria bacterium GWC2_49_35 TaxID=1817813 RepID=A0A1F7WNS1_9BACT|nr:MAG: hypothetical protein A2008_08140 [Candidatus Wallbacteria bacterium GWC2_49_35]